MEEKLNLTQKAEKKVLKTITKKIERLKKAEELTPYKQELLDYWQLIKDKILNGDL